MARSVSIFAMVWLSTLLSTVLFASDIRLGRGQIFGEDINTAIVKDPNNPDLYNIRGNHYLIDGHYKKAISDFSRAIYLNSSDCEPYNGRGIAYRNIGKNIDAMSDYNMAINLCPNYIEAYKNRGVLYMYTGNHEMMCIDFEKSCFLGDCKKYNLAREKGLCF